MRISTILTALLFIAGLSMQAQQLENPGFENWENAGTVQDEPVDWSSVKTSDGGTIVNGAAPVVWWKSTDAHSGTSSVELKCVLTLGTIIVNGNITNGRVHAEFNPSNGYIFTSTADPKWNTPFTARPDSAAIWVKYTPTGTDTAQVKIILHTGEGTQPPTPANMANRVGFAQINITGNVSTWTRFVVPITYFSTVNPEYILVILTSGAGFEALEGSMARFDDLEMIYNANSINDPEKEQPLVYTNGKTIYFDKLPSACFQNSTVEILSMSGSVIYSDALTSSRISLDRLSISKGLYILRIRGKEMNFVQKIQLY